MYHIYRCIEASDEEEVMLLAKAQDEQVVLERNFFIDNLMLLIHFIFVMIRWTGLAPW